MALALKKRHGWYIIFVSVVITFSLILSYPATSVNVLDSPCKSDCTTFDNICSADCDNVNGCSYPSANDYLGYDYIIGLAEPKTIKEICNLQKAGWVKPFNSTYNVVCCNNIPTPKLTSTKLSISVDSSVKNIVTVSRYVNYNGKIVTMHISVWD
jgi:hypothetical protein